MDAGVVGWLTSAEGRAAVASARGSAGDALARSAALRRAGLDAARAAAVLEQADLLDRAVAGGVIADGFVPLPLLTRDGLEQATRMVVADRRAGLLLRAGARTVVDVTAGLGLDATAVVRTGMRSVAVERDPFVATLLAANVPAARVVVGDATVVVDDLLATVGPEDAVFVDPARRMAGRRSADGARALPERDPEQWSPPLSWVVGLARRLPRVVAKVNPGFAHERVPDGWHAEWVSVDGSRVETTLWSFDAVPRRQVVVIRDGVAHELSGGENVATTPAGAVDAYLLEPDDAFGPSGLVDALAVSLDAQRVGHGMWLTSSAPVESPFARRWRVVDELSTATKALRQALVAYGVGNVTVKSRGTGIDAATARRDLRLTKGAAGTVVLLRDANALRAYLVER